MKALTDLEILMKHDLGARYRAAMEICIARKLLETATASGYTLRVREWEQEGGPGSRKYDFMTALFDLDDAHVTVHDEHGKRIGWVYFVFGNDGYDCISDYGTNLEDWLKPVNDYAESLESGAWLLGGEVQS